jgi:hypothetical protein
MDYVPPEFAITIAPRFNYKVLAAQYALTALRMSLNQIPVDLAYDLNGSGTVTTADALAYQKIAEDIDIGFTPSTSSNYYNLMQPLQQITLNIEGGVSSDIKLEIVKKEFEKRKVWNDVDPTDSRRTLSIMNSTSTQAKFLQAEPAELPDKYYFGGDIALVTSGGSPLTDINNEPLEGF